LVLFLHGLEGSPEGRKAQALRKAGYAVEAPDLRRLPLEERLQRVEALTHGRTDLTVVGSSLGGLLAALLTHEHPDRVGGLVLCAPALRPEYDGRVGRTPPHTVIVHGVADDVVPIDLSRRFARQHHVELVETRDGHRLADSLGEILQALRTVLRRYDAPPGT